MTDELLELALVDPGRAEQTALRVLGVAEVGPRAVLAHRALGVVHRDRVQLDRALEHLRTAVLLARGLEDDALLADVRATLGATLSAAGHPHDGLVELDAALEVAGPHVAMTRLRRAVALAELGRLGEAAADNQAAAAAFRSEGAAVWEARALRNLGFNELEAGATDLAAEHTQRAHDLLAAHGLDREAAMARENLGEIAEARGDLPAALAVYDALLSQDAGAEGRPHLASARTQVLLKAGLGHDAAEVAERALTQPDLTHEDRAWLLMLAAEARLAVGDGDAALARAVGARDLYLATGNQHNLLRARYLCVRAAPTMPEAADVALALHERGLDLAPTALVLAAGLTDEAGPLLDLASTYASRAEPLVRAPGWLALARRASLAGDVRRALRACARGLDALDDHRQSLGSTELRALATAHGRELASLALRHAAGEPRSLLGWSERWRATSLAQPPVTPGHEPVLESLAALRDNGRRLAEARAEGEPTDQLEKDRARLEREVRAEHHRQAGRAGEAPRLDVRRLVDEVGGGCLVELVDVDGVLHVLVVHDGRVRRTVAGTTQAALALTQSAGFVLRRAARGRPYTPGDLGQRLQDELLGDAARLIPDGPATVVPTGRLHGVPWALLPALQDRAFAVVPSAGQWLRARAVPASIGGTVLLSGPGLGTGGAEVPVLAARSPGAQLLTGRDATVEAAMAALDGAHLAHVAAHGRFRADSPLFSSLEMADGPLTVYDLERLAVAPYRVVLSACESGVLAPVGADELLGLASALFALGTAGLVCSVAEVNDEATAELMVDLHAHLDAGADPAVALLAVREARPVDPTAASFVALGV